MRDYTTCEYSLKEILRMYPSQKQNEPIWKSEDHEGTMNIFINMLVTLSKHCVQFQKSYCPIWGEILTRIKMLSNSIILGGMSSCVLTSLITGLPTAGSPLLMSIPSRLFYSLSPSTSADLSRSMIIFLLLTPTLQPAVLVAAGTCQ